MFCCIIGKQINGGRDYSFLTFIQAIGLLKGSFNGTVITFHYHCIIPNKKNEALNFAVLQHRPSHIQLLDLSLPPSAGWRLLNPHS